MSIPCPFCQGDTAKFDVSVGPPPTVAYRCKPCGAWWKPSELATAHREERRHRAESRRLPRFETIETHDGWDNLTGEQWQAFLAVQSTAHKLLGACISALPFVSAEEHPELWAHLVKVIEDAKHVLTPR